jgi:hypothetical protein
MFAWTLRISGLAGSALKDGRSCKNPKSQLEIKSAVAFSVSSLAPDAMKFVDCSGEGWGKPGSSRRRGKILPPAPAEGAEEKDCQFP